MSTLMARAETKELPMLKPVMESTGDKVCFFWLQKDIRNENILGHANNRSGTVSGHQDSNRAELRAAQQAIKTVERVPLHLIII